TPADVATVLFLGRLPLRGIIADPEINSMLFGASFETGMEEPTEKQFRKLFEAWLNQRDSVEALHAGMHAILYFGLREGTPAARRVLLRTPSALRLTADALLVIGHHGTKSDLPLVFAFRDDNRVSGNTVNPAGKLIGTHEVCDVAAAMALKLSGEDFTKY